MFLPSIKEKWRIGYLLSPYSLYHRFLNLRCCWVDMTGLYRLHSLHIPFFILYKDVKTDFVTKVILDLSEIVV